MPFKKGESGNPNGRTPGTPNRVTGDLRQRIQQLLDEQFDNLQADFKALDPKERVNAFIRLLEYTTPKLQRTETTFDLSKLTEEQVDSLFARALENANEYEKAN